MNRLMDGTQPSYTYALGAKPRTYRGIIRRRTDGGGIWECWDSHSSPTEARECAQREWRRLMAEDAPAECRR